MKKTTVTISYDEEKVKALRLYLELKGSKLEDELTKIIETLYTKIGILLFLQKKFRLSIKKFERRNRFIWSKWRDSFAFSFPKGNEN